MGYIYSYEDTDDYNNDDDNDSHKLGLDSLSRVM